MSHRLHWCLREWILLELSRRNDLLTKPYLGRRSGLSQRRGKITVIIGFLLVRLNYALKSLKKMSKLPIYQSYYSFIKRIYGVVLESNLNRKATDYSRFEMFNYSN